MKKIEYEEMLFARFVCSRADKWFFMFSICRANKHWYFYLTTILLNWFGGCVKNLTTMKGKKKSNMFVNSLLLRKNFILTKLSFLGKRKKNFFEDWKSRVFNLDENNISSAVERN